jgi:hypothetical protein
LGELDDVSLGVIENELDRETLSLRDCDGIWICPLLLLVMDLLGDSVFVGVCVLELVGVELFDFVDVFDCEPDFVKVLEVV